MKAIHFRLSAAALSLAMMLSWGCSASRSRLQQADASASRQELPASGLSRDSIAKIQAIQPAASGFRFIFFGDNRDRAPDTTEGDQVYAGIIALINQQQPLFAIHGGDFTYDNTPNHWNTMLHIQAGLRVPLMTVAGNHDVIHGRTLYEGNFAAPNSDTGLEDYSFDYGGVRFVALDDANGTITPRQLAWLSRQLQTRLHKVVMAHMPPHIAPWQGHSLSDEAASAQWLKVLDDAQVDMVLLSHIHLFDDSVKRGNTQYIVSGGAGAPFRKEPFGTLVHHVVVIDVGGDGRLSYRMVPLA